MILAKKLTFAPIFLVLLATLLYFASPLLKTTDIIFSLNLQTFYQLIILSILILASSLAFVIFASLSLDWKIILPVILISSVIPLDLVLGIGIAISLLSSFIVLENRMKGYLNFQASSLLSPSIKQLTGFLIIALSVSFYLSANKQIVQKGFEIPDSLIESSLNLMPQTNLSVQGYKYNKRLIAQLPQITPEQIQLLKQNPDLLKQYGVDPKMLDSLTTTTNSNSNLTAQAVKPLIKQQLQTMIKPFQNFIAPILALLLFLTLQSFTAILGLFISPIVWIIFYILEKTKFIHFEAEMREVKKLVV